jgi:hypothetical protein
VHGARYGARDGLARAAHPRRAVTAVEHEGRLDDAAEQAGRERVVRAASRSRPGPRSPARAGRPRSRLAAGCPDRCGNPAAQGCRIRRSARRREAPPGGTSLVRIKMAMPIALSRPDSPTPVMTPLVDRPHRRTTGGDGVHPVATRDPPKRPAKFRRIISAAPQWLREIELRNPVKIALGEIEATQRSSG